MIRIGNIITSPEIAKTLPKRLVAMKSWDNSAFRSATWSSLDKTGLYWESVFDAAHGRRYVLFLFKSAGYSPLTGEHIASNRALRNECFDALSKA